MFNAQLLLLRRSVLIGAVRGVALTTVVFASPISHFNEPALVPLRIVTFSSAHLPLIALLLVSLNRTIMLWPFGEFLETLFLLKDCQVVLAIGEENELSVTIPRETACFGIGNEALFPQSLVLMTRYFAVNGALLVGFLR